MSHKQQKQILAGLESGRKLFDLMREPGMPSKALLEEWRDNDPEFEAKYLAAEEAGRKKRGDQPTPAKPKPAPVVTDEDGREHLIPRSTALQPGQQYPGLAFDPADPLDAASDETLPDLAEALAEVLAHAPTDEEQTVPFADKVQRALEAGLIGPADYVHISAEASPQQAEERFLALLQARTESIATAAETQATQNKKQQAAAKARATLAANREQKKQQPAIGGASKVAQDMQQYVQGLELQVSENARQQVTHRVELAELRGLYDKAVAFKTYVHERLDAEGINPHEAENSVTGCRVGRRLDDVFISRRELRQQLTDYQEYQADVKRLTRELDVALFGEENAALQASLCDLISPARKLAESLRQHASQTEQRETVNQPAAVPHPGHLLAAAIDLVGTNRKQLAKALGIKYDTLKGLLLGKQNLTLQLCAALEAANWGAAEVWSRRQIDYLNHQNATITA